MRRRISRRAALQLGAGAGAAALAAPYVGRLGRSAVVDLTGAEPATAIFNPFWKVPRIVTRAQWGADESLRKSGQIYDTTISKIIVHHTGTPNSITNYSGLCRGILSNETAGEYIDIAYNWLIDPGGNIYEGRWAKDYGSTEPHTGELNWANVRGGHAIYHNSNTIGIALMGDYQDVDPPGAMIDALVVLLSWKCARWGIDPVGRGTYYASNGAVETLDNITGHRDTSATDCPGGRTETMLPAIRSRVAKRLTGGDYWIMSDHGRVVTFGTSPYLGGDATTLATDIEMHPSRNGYWIVEVNGHVRNYNTVRPGDLVGQSIAGGLACGIACTATGNGYWIASIGGGVYAFGDADPHLGSRVNQRLASPVVGIVRSPSGNGYWLFCSNGDVWGYGDVRYMPPPVPHSGKQSIIAMGARPQSDGYWLLGDHGGVYNYGAAPDYGSGSTASNPSHYTGILPTPTGKGYGLLRKDGSVEPYGDARPQPGARGMLSTDAIAIAGRMKM